MAQHVETQQRYLTVFAALIVLTALTVAVSRLELGALNVPVALGIAAFKATLVGLFFMHLLHSTRLTWVIVTGSLFFTVILFALTLSDYLTRAGWPVMGK
jgi:cytochrome c oxidase subunit 4